MTAACMFCGQTTKAEVEIGDGRKISFTCCASCGDFDVSPDVVARLASDLVLKQRLALQVKEATQERKILVAAIDAVSDGVMIERTEHVAASHPDEPPPESTQDTRPLRSVH